MNRLDSKLIFDLKQKFFNHIMDLSYDFHSSHRTGSLIARITRGGRAIEGIADFLFFETTSVIANLIAIFIYSENIRKILLDPHSNISPLSELFLYEAARAQHVSDIIMPALKKGHVVISDRFTLASIAYQGYGRKLSIKTVETLNRIATGGLKPDIAIILNIPDRVFNERERLAEKLLGVDRIESASSNFRKRVNKAYKILSKKQGVIKINAINSIEDIKTEIRNSIAAAHPKMLKKIRHKISR